MFPLTFTLTAQKIAIIMRGKKSEKVLLRSRSIHFWNKKSWIMSCGPVSLKVHKIEIFFGSNFGICVISFLFRSKY
jgi:hypothetical protein